MTNYYIKGASDKWVRPAGWLTMPTITAADNKLAFLLAVYPNRKNTFTIQYGSVSINATIDWGDGNTTTVTNNTIQVKDYDYSSVSSIILQDKLGNDYKQVIVLLTYNSGVTNFTWSMGASGTGGGSSQMLEAILSWTDNVNLTNQSNGAHILENLIIKKLTARSNTASMFRQMSGLQNFEGFENITWNATAASSMFIAIGIRRLGNLNITCTSAQGFFQSCSLEYVGNLNFIPNPTGGVLTNFLTNSVSLKETGTITAPLFDNLTGFFNGNSSLYKMGPIDMPNVTLLNSTFNGCYALQEIIFTSTCVNVVGMTSTFNNCRSLRKLRLPNISVSFTIFGCALLRPELIDLFDDLATVPGQTLIITGNPGVADLLPADLLIATSKGWTVTTV
jgi:GH24 family phage-related lysozyme (muramidase)